MATSSLISIDHQGSPEDAALELVDDNTQSSGLKLMKWMKGVVSGMNGGVVTVLAGAVKASGTATLVSVVATDSITIAGTTLTAVASGATSAQFNVGANDTATAANLAAAINANTALQGIVDATSALGVVTITAAKPGKLGNLIAVTKTGSTITLSGAALTGGTEGTSSKFAYGTN